MDLVQPRSKAQEKRQGNCTRFLIFVSTNANGRVPNNGWFDCFALTAYVSHAFYFSFRHLRLWGRNSMHRSWMKVNNKKSPVNLTSRQCPSCSFLFQSREKPKEKKEGAAHHDHSPCLILSPCHFSTCISLQEKIKLRSSFFFHSRSLSSRKLLCSLGIAWSLAGTTSTLPLHHPMLIFFFSFFSLAGPAQPFLLLLLSYLPMLTSISALAHKGHN